ncbi:unnamed protein product [Rhizoctonia solani]|uniref:Uncharacterized protein n=1 Tax=Rhizoctonia solani TaxID=456999 RepID=A0A8H3B8B4_9AGAM|nr:unnamed protein product [Rhizoctonia solani]
MTRQLTLDVLMLIAEQLARDKPTLLKMTMLRKEVYSLVLPVLYHSNEFLELTGALRFCHAIIHHPESPGRFVHRLYMQVPFWGIPIPQISPNPSLFEIIRMSLNHMPNLQDLSLFGLSLFNPIDLSDCPFKLKSLLITPPTTQFTARLIRNQPTIVELNLASFTLGHQCVDTNHFIGPGILPNLNTLTACPKAIKFLAPGRPIEHVFMQVCSVDALNTASILATLTSLDQTSTPVKSLWADLDGHPEVNGWNLIELLKSTNLPSNLVCLTIKANLLDFALQQAKDPSYLSSVAQLLQGFTFLKYFEVEEAIQGVIEQPAAHEVIDMMFAVLEQQTDIGALWRQNCPNLISVKLFDRNVV